MRARNLAVCLLGAGLGLGGCAIVPKPPPLEPHQVDAVWEERTDQLADLDSWHLKGRLGVRTVKRGGTATVIWDRAKNEHKLELYGPLGGGRVRIVQDEDGATWTDSKKRVERAETAQALLYQRAGWHVPFDSMQYWVAGRPAPGPYDERTLDDWGRLKTLQQAGWEVSFLDYRSVEPFELPRKIFARALPGTVHLVDQKGRDLGDQLHVKLVIRRWEPAATP